MIVRLRNYSRARIARNNTKKLRRLQTIDKRRANALLMMARQVKDKMFKKIEVVVKKKYPFRGLVFLRLVMVNECNGSHDPDFV